MSSEPENIDYRETLNVTRAHAAAAREKGEPAARHEPLPLWPLVCFFGITILAGGYLGQNSAYFDSAATVRPGYQPSTPGLGPGEQVEDTGDPAEKWLKRGKAVYKKGACAGCHQASGMGVPGQYPPLAGSEWVLEGTERLSMIMLHGLSGPLTVAGKTYNGLMPAQGATLNDKEIAQLMSYIRNEWGNEGSFVTEEMVATARNKYQAQGGPFTQGDLEAVPADEMLPGAPFGAAADAEATPAPEGS